MIDPRSPIILKILKKPTPLLVRKGLNEFYDSTNDRAELLEYLEYEYLPLRKNIVEQTIELFNGAFRFMTISAERNIDCLETWIQEKKQINRIEMPNVESFQSITTSFIFENNFDNVITGKIYLHFKNGLVDSKMLNEIELNDYLKAAFENNTPPKSLFNIKNAPSKDKVMKVFYLYFTNVAGKPHGKAKAYAGLLGNYFQGYKTDTVSSNFSKTVY